MNELTLSFRWCYDDCTAKIKLIHMWLVFGSDV